MDKRPSFTDDLDAIREDVTSDVSKILKLAKGAASPAVEESQNTLQPESSVPVAKRSANVAKRLPSEPPLHARSDRSVYRNVTTRLSFEVDELLTEVALRRRLNKMPAATRQGVIEFALREFFSRHGYARRSGQGNRKETLQAAEPDANPHRGADLMLGRDDPPE